LPKVPTFQEAGFAEPVLEQWLGVMVPAGRLVKELDIKIK
jgi:tripartite-type tricarboxylate transporter receptor subunit TctC